MNTSLFSVRRVLSAAVTTPTCATDEAITTPHDALVEAAFKSFTNAAQLVRGDWDLLTDADLLALRGMLDAGLESLAAIYAAMQRQESTIARLADAETKGKQTIARAQHEIEETHRDIAGLLDKVTMLFNHTKVIRYYGADAARPSHSAPRAAAANGAR